MSSNTKIIEMDKDFCRDCGIEISKHNLYLHAGLCNDCFFKFVKKAEDTENEDDIAYFEDIQLSNKREQSKN